MAEWGTEAYIVATTPFYYFGYKALAQTLLRQDVSAILFQLISTLDPRNFFRYVN